MIKQRLLHRTANSRRRALLGFAVIAVVLSGTAFFFATNLAATKVLQHTSPAGLDQFGFAVAASGDRVLVGAFADDVGAANVGSAFIFEKDAGGAGNWGQVKQLTAFDAASNDQYGVAVDLDGDTAVIGAFADGSADTGSAYVYERAQGGAGTWGLAKKLNVAGLSGSAFFGRSVAIDGDTIVVSAYTNVVSGLNFAGSIWIFSRNLGGTNNWGEVKRIDSPTPATNGQFGWDVSVSGDTIVVAELGFGRVRFFERDSGGAGNWGNTATVSGSGLFAWVAEISGDTAVVGAITATNAGGVAAGTAFILERNQGGANAWGVVKQLSATDGVVNDQFGLSADIEGDTVVVGAFAQDATGTDSGAAYYFSRDDGGAGNWGEVNKLIGSSGTAQHWMGFSVATTGARAVVGAPHNNNLGPIPDAGFAYVFDLPGVAPPPPTVAPNQPTTTSPSGSIADSMPTYSWPDVSGATQYRVAINSNGGAANFEDHTVNAADVCSGGTCSLDSPPVATLAEGAYRWWVRASNSVGNSAWSVGKDFTFTPPPPSSAPALAAPSGGTTNPVPTYNWSAVSGATKYRVVVNSSGGVSNFEDHTVNAADVCSGSTCSLASPPVAVLPNGSYVWWVRGSNSSGTGPWSSGTSFSVIAASPGAAPTLTSPSGSITNPMQTYSWSAVTGATKYRIAINSNGGVTNFDDVLVNAADVCSGATCSLGAPPAAALPDGSYVWWAQARNDGGAGPWSSGTAFSVAAVRPNSAPNPISPSGTITDATPTYMWSAVPGATQYRIAINGNSGATNFDDQLVNATSVCSSGICSLTSPPASSLSNGAYRWWVQGRNSAGTGPWSVGTDITKQ